MVGFKSDCKGCDKRYPGCHDHCKSFLKAKAEYEKTKALSKKDEELRQYAVTRSFTRRDEMSMQKKRHSGYNRLKGLH